MWCFCQILTKPVRLVRYPDEDIQRFTGKSRSLKPYPLPVIISIVSNVYGCQTGIDIRERLQLACMHCGRCGDACDHIMKDLQRPTVLISMKSKAQLRPQPKIKAASSATSLGRYLSACRFNCNFFSIKP